MRKTASAVETARAAGILGVEMAAALYAFAAVLKRHV